MGATHACMTLACPSQAIFGGYTRLNRVDDILQYDRMERWLNILLLWASSFEAGLKTKPTLEQVQTVRADFPKYALLKAREFPLRVCYYDFECFNSFGLLIDEQGSLGAYKNQVRHVLCKCMQLPSHTIALAVLQAVEGWMKVFNGVLQNSSNGFAKCAGAPRKCE